MSSLEPATTAKVVLITTKGPIEIEIWAKEVPNISRLFIQNCIDKKYIGTSFNKVIKDYLVQTSKINEQETSQLKDEFHSRLKFNKRGLVGAVHTDKRNTNNVDSIFITLKPALEFNNNYVLFGKIIGESIYNVVKVNESEMKSDETPMYPAEITDIKVPIQYFDDIIESKKQIAEPVRKKPKKAKKSRVKLNYDLEDEPDTGFKMKSAHDLLSDKRLSNKLYLDKHTKSSSDVKNDAKHEEIQEKIVSNSSLNHEDEPIGPRSENIILDNLSDDHIAEQKAEKRSTKAKWERNPNIDSDYDSDLDLSSSESIDLHAFNANKFQKR